MTTTSAPARALRDAPARLTSATASALAAAFFVAGRLRRRRRKPLHPDGAVLPGTLRGHGGSGRWGVPFLDEAGQADVVVRLSRSAGTPSPLPDVLGMAVRIPHGDGVSDLLMSSAGPGVPGRFLLRPRLAPGRSAYTTLLPYRGPHGPVMLAALPEPPRRLPARPDRLAAAIAARPVTFRLACARPRGPWETFAWLTVTGPVEPGLDRPLAFDPVLNPLPGLSMYDVLAAVRSRTYASARRARRPC